MCNPCSVVCDPCSVVCNPCCVLQLIAYELLHCEELVYYSAMCNPCSEVCNPCSVIQLIRLHCVVWILPIQLYTLLSVIHACCVVCITVSTCVHYLSISSWFRFSHCWSNPEHNCTDQVLLCDNFVRWMQL